MWKWISRAENFIEDNFKSKAKTIPTTWRLERWIKFLDWPCLVNFGHGNLVQRKLFFGIFFQRGRSRLYIDLCHKFFIWHSISRNLSNSSWVYYSFRKNRIVNYELYYKAYTFVIGPTFVRLLLNPFMISVSSNIGRL